MNSATERCVTVRVTGRVQGVSFRYWTMEEATKLGLRGWVRNEPGGSVTALLAGSDSAVALMLEGFGKGRPGRWWPMSGRRKWPTLPLRRPDSALPAKA